MARLPRILLALAAMGLGGCYITHGRGGPNPPDAGLDGGPPPDRALRGRDAEVDASRRDGALEGVDGGGDAGRPREVICESPVGVDLLLVLDDSGSFRPEDEVLRDRLARILRRLARPLDLDRDGNEDWPRVQDMHVGIVSTSVQGPPFCGHVSDGALRRGAGADFPTCRREPYPPYQSYLGPDDPEALIEDVACVAFGPREGCQVEQPLEAIAKALLPSDAPFDYIAGGPRGDTANAGFLRPDSVLAVLIFTDEDDCSVVDPSIFEPPDNDAGAAMPLFDAGAAEGAPGCQGAAEEQLHSPERYVEVLRYLRPHHPERVVFGFVGGIEPAVTTRFAGHLGSCGGTDYPRRIVDFAQRLEPRAVGGSVCHLAEIAFVQAVAAQIADAACED